MRKILACLVLCVLWNLAQGAGAQDARYGQENAVWVQSLFFRGHQPTTQEPLRHEDIVFLAETLKKAGIKYVYMFSGPYGVDGSVPEYAFSETAQASVKKISEIYPELKILPWLGGLQDKTVFLNNPKWVGKAVSDTEKLVRVLGVPGVHLDFEYILPTSRYVVWASGLPAQRSSEVDYGTGLTQFHKKLREKLPNAFISAVFPSSAPGVVSWKKSRPMMK